MSAILGGAVLTVILAGMLAALVWVLGFVISAVVSFVVAVITDIRRHWPAPGVPVHSGMGQPVTH